MSAPDLKRAAHLMGAYQRKRAPRAGAWDPRAGATPAQRPLLDCMDPLVAVCCGRRSGKSDAFARILREGAATGVDAPQFYVGPTLKHARLNFWPTLKRLVTASGHPHTTNEVDLQLRISGREPITLAGANDAGEIQKIRGAPRGAKTLIVDEAQLTRPSMLGVLVDEVSEPMLMDWGGRFYMGGTPGAIPAGYWYDAATAGRWRAFSWTVRDNPELPFVKSGGDLTRFLAELRERHGWTEQSPTYLREYLGQWVRDDDALALHYQAQNACEFAEPQDGWSYVLGVDLGYIDSDAFVVIGWPAGSKVVHHVHELVRPKQHTGTTLAAVEAIITKYHPIRAVVDAGGLGLKIVEEWRQRWKLPLEAAQKKDKAMHLGLLDEAMRAGRLLSPPSSRFAEDCGLVQWDPDKLAIGERKLNDAGYHSDVVDAMLYAFRACHAFTEVEPVAPIPSTPEREAEAMRASAMATMVKRQRNDWWEEA